MHKQRIFISLTAIAGIVSSFLPWYNHSYYGTMTGFSKGGWLTMIFYGLTLLISLFSGDTHKSLYGIRQWLGLVSSILASGVGFLMLYTIKNVYKGTVILNTDWQKRSISEIPFTIDYLYGLYMVSIFGILIVIFAFLLKEKKLETISIAESPEQQSI